MDAHGPTPDATSLFDRVGGMAFFDELAGHFYDGIVTDELLAPMYPEDLEGARQRLALFLAQYWGGPPIYSQQRGHPRLRMRHAPFPIDEAARDAWMGHMERAVSAMPLDDADRDAMVGYFAAAADHLRNTV